MSDVEFNETINGYRGAIGKLVFRKVKSSKPPTETQLKQRACMSEAVAFGRLAKVDPALSEFYDPIAEQKESSIYQTALQAYLKEASRKLYGSSKDEDCSDSPKLAAIDDTGLSDLNVKLVAQDGTSIATGKAVETDVRSVKWAYTVNESLAAGTVILIEINGRDLVNMKARLTAPHSPSRRITAANGLSEQPYNLLCQ